jgi:hypothetical protein
MIYRSPFHSIMSYGIMFWGNSPHSHVIFKMQKMVLRILIGIGYRESCRESFKELKILALSSQYIFSLLFVFHNRDYFASNSAYCNINNRWKNDFRLPWLCIRREFFYSSIKVCKALPTAINDISSNPKKFKVTLKHYLLTHSFYSLDDFFLPNRILNLRYVYYLITLYNYQTPLSLLYPLLSAYYFINYLAGLRLIYSVWR